MPRKIPERIAWAVDVLEVHPDEKLLEIGCGRGIAVSAICESLVTGSITAIDRSAKMVRAAADLNRSNIAAGKAEIINAELVSAELPAHAFDKVFAFNVNAFWLGPAAELNAVEHLMAPGGKFYIFHQPPPGNDPREYAQEFQKYLAASGFVVKEVLYKKLKPADAVCVISEKMARTRDQ